MAPFSTLKHLAVRDQDKNGKPLQSLITHISANALGTRVVNARQDLLLRLWKFAHLRPANPVLIENAHTTPAECVAWSTASEGVFVSVGDKTVKVWRDNGRLQREFSVQNPARLCLYAPDGSILAVLTETVIYLYDTESYLLLAEHTLTDSISAFTWTNQGQLRFLVGLATGNIGIFEYNPEDGTISCITTLTGLLSVTCLAMDPRGRYIVAGSRDGVVSFWSTADLVNYRVLSGVDQEVTAVSLNRDGLYICVAFKLGSNIKVFEVDTGKEIYELPDSAGTAEHSPCIVWSTNNTVMFYLDENGKSMAYTRKEDERDREIEKERLKEKERKDRERERPRERDHGRDSERDKGRDRDRDRDRDNGKDLRRDPRRDPRARVSRERDDRRRWD